MTWMTRKDECSSTTWLMAADLHDWCYKLIIICTLFYIIFVLSKLFNSELTCEQYKEMPMKNKQTKNLK